MISFDDFTSDGGSVNLSPIYNYISILSSNSYELYTMITNIPTTFSTPYMKEYNSTDGDYQYNISGSINSLVLSNTYDNIEGNYKLFSCTISNHIMINMNLESMGSNIYSKNKFINITNFINGNNTYSSNTKLNAYGNNFINNTVNSMSLCDINCLFITNNVFTGNPFSNIIKCSDFRSNSIYNLGHYDISANRIYPNTFSKLIRLNLNCILTLSDSTNPFIFDSIQTLQLNKYIPTSKNAIYSNITYYILGHPEELFDSNGSFTQTELDSNKVYLSEVPVSLLGGSSPYMKEYNSTDGNYQYNISQLSGLNGSSLCVKGNYSVSNIGQTTSQDYLNLEGFEFRDVSLTAGCHKMNFSGMYADTVRFWNVNNLDLNVYGLQYGELFTGGKANITANEIAYFSPISVTGYLNLNANLLYKVDLYSGNRYITLNLARDLTISEGDYAEIHGKDISILSAENVNTLKLNVDSLVDASISNVSKLYLDKYVSGVNTYSSIGKFVLGSPELLFDSLNRYTCDLASQDVYLSEVPLNMLMSNPNYMKDFKLTDGNYQYNISGFGSESVINFSESAINILGNAVCSAKTFNSFNSLNLSLQAIDACSIDGRNGNIEAYEINDNSFNNIMDINMRCKEFNNNSLSLTSVGVIRVSAKNIGGGDIAGNTVLTNNFGKTVSLNFDLMISSMKIENVHKLYLKGNQVSNISISNCDNVYFDVDTIYGVDIQNCGYVDLSKPQQSYLSGWTLQDIDIINLHHLDPEEFQLNCTLNNIAGVNLVSMNLEELSRWKANSNMFIYNNLTISREHLSYNNMLCYAF